MRAHEPHGIAVVSEPGVLAEAAGLDLKRTLASGQTFRWRWHPDPEAGDIATGIVGRHLLRVRAGAQGIRLLSPDTAEARTAFRRYFGTPQVFGGIPAIEQALARDPVLTRVLPHTRGIAILTQDPWEVLISFIISQNNNIPKISRSIERLARSLGDPLEDAPAGGTAHAFPAPARLAAAPLRTLRACQLGYRAPYVRAAGRMVAEGRLDLAALRRMSEDDARAALQGIPGVGEKVGACILLFGLGHMTAFPVDVWGRRAVERLYFRGRPRTLREVQAFARTRFGPLAGYAQQHLYAYARARLRTGLR